MCLVLCLRASENYCKSFIRNCKPCLTIHPSHGGPPEPPQCSAEPQQRRPSGHQGRAAVQTDRSPQDGAGPFYPMARRKSGSEPQPVGSNTTAKSSFVITASGDIGSRLDTWIMLDSISLESGHCMVLSTLSKGISLATAQSTKTSLLETRPL